MVNLVRATREELETLSQAVFEQAGLPEADAAVAANVLVMSDLLGIDTHGVSRLPSYVALLRTGAFNPTPKIEFNASTSSVTVVEGDNGVGQLVGARAMDVAISQAKEQGISYVGCRNSQHFGALVPFALKAAEAGIVCILGTNSLASMAPWRGREICLGNNPLGFGAPRLNGPPMLLDIAMSVVARGKMRKAADQSESIPLGWALDSDGNSTTDPLEGLQGYVLPIGEHKGYGLALMVDILAGVLTGGGLSSEVRSLYKQKDKPQQVSHFFIAIDPERVIGLETYYQRIETLAQIMKSVAPLREDQPVLLPGEIEVRQIKERTASGIPIDPNLLESLRGLARGEAPTVSATV